MATLPIHISDQKGLKQVGSCSWKIGLCDPSRTEIEKTLSLSVLGDYSVVFLHLTI